MDDYTRTTTLDERTTGSMARPETDPHPLAEAGQEAVDSAGHLASRAADMGIQQADRGRELAATGLQNVANSIRRISLDMGTEQPAIADVADTAAQQAERVATYLRDTDARQIINNVEEMARRQPLLFLGGAFVLGLAASRFLKAAGSGNQDDTRRRIAAGRPDGTGAYEPTGPGVRSSNGGF